MARQGTWDIYCHSFMLAAIWSLTASFKMERPSYIRFALSGLLFGLSFMSKGPVSFYVVLLPYLLAYTYSFGTSELRAHSKGIILCLGVCLLVSMWWPLYTYLHVPHELVNTVSTETGSWQNRSVKPFWRYWSFPVQSGIWTIFIVLSLLPFYAIRRVEQAGGKYRFLFLWVLITIFLLSVIPDKKERYLMQGLISQALLVSFLLRYFIMEFALKPSKSDRFILNFIFFLIILVCFMSPVVLYHLAFDRGLIPTAHFLGISITLTAFGAGLCYLIANKKVFIGILTMFILVAVLCVWLPVIYNHVVENKLKQTLSISLKSTDFPRELNYYSLGSLRPEEIWELGKMVKPLSDINSLKHLSESSMVLFYEDKQMIADESSSNIDSVINIGVFQHPSNPEVSWMVSILHLGDNTGL
jgi:4-amino-4-deoxy-L-arabinose transferase-like glycosyltransferase